MVSNHIAISIHAPRTGSDVFYRLGNIRKEFQSTLPARGATLSAFMLSFLTRYFNPRSPHGERRPHKPGGGAATTHFNPRSPHGERRSSSFRRASLKRISIHAPRTGSDRCARALCGLSGISIHAPRTGSDVHRVLILLTENISIHAPRTGSDSRTTLEPRTRGNFNPRSPHGERRTSAAAGRRLNLFQSTLPARGATPLVCKSSCA